MCTGTSAGSSNVTSIDAAGRQSASVSVSDTP
jgi:hypothetical protein